MSQRLQGKRAIVTGGGSGIGRSAALKLAAEGAMVGVLDMDLTAAERVADEIRQLSGTALAVLVDVAQEAEVQSAIATVETHFGGLDTVIANAGVMLFESDTIATELD